MSAIIEQSEHPIQQKRAVPAHPGFTLIEMLAALTILALVAAIALPNMTRPSDGLRLQTATQNLLGALRLTRAAAIARNAAMVLEIDVDRRSFTSPVVAMRSFPSDVRATLTVAKPERPTRSRGGFRFFPDGSSTGGDVILRLHDNQAEICVNWLTGEAREGQSISAPPDHDVSHSTCTSPAAKPIATQGAP